MIPSAPCPVALGSASHPGFGGAPGKPRQGRVPPAGGPAGRPRKHGWCQVSQLAAGSLGWLAPRFGLVLAGRPGCSGSKPHDPLGRGAAPPARAGLLLGCANAPAPNPIHPTPEPSVFPGSGWL
jgi:hypothetical protein